MPTPRLSIYQSRYKRPTNFDESQTGIGGGGPSTAYRPPNGQGLTTDWSSLRKAQPVNVLLPASREWLRNLPSDLQPRALAAKYPRIVNVLAVEWANPTACRAYFAELLTDHRGNRRGFPADVHRDVLTLRDHYYSLHLALAE